MNQLYGTARYLKRKAARRIKLYIAGGALCVILIFAAYAVGYSGLFTVRAISFDGIDKATADTLIAHMAPQVVRSFPGNYLGTHNYFSWRAGLHYEDVAFSGITLSKDLLRRTITIHGIPRQRYAVWCVERPHTDEAASPADDRCYWIDSTGMLFADSAVPDGQLILKITEHSSSTNIALGDQAIENPAFTAIKKILDGVAAMRLPVSQMLIDREHEELKLYTMAQTAVIFSYRFDPLTAALPALQKLREQGLGKFDYIDLTVENKALVKPR